MIIKHHIQMCIDDTIRSDIADLVKMDMWDKKMDKLIVKIEKLMFHIYKEGYKDCKKDSKPKKK